MEEPKNNDTLSVKARTEYAAVTVKFRFGRPAEESSENRPTDYHYLIHVQFIIPVPPTGRHFVARSSSLGPRRYSRTQHIRDNELVLDLYNM
ncbi:hypothetical protein N7501_010261 [Penicillium viridicatum]|nr:hypothetical protein N7501_010261 [Penicillium viridicatum]